MGAGVGVEVVPAAELAAGADAGLGEGSAVALERGAALRFVTVEGFAEGFFEEPAVGGAEDLVAARFGRLAEEARGEVFVVKAI